MDRLNDEIYIDYDKIIAIKRFKCLNKAPLHEEFFTIYLEGGGHIIVEYTEEIFEKILIK